MLAARCVPDFGYVDDAAAAALKETLKAAADKAMSGPDAKMVVAAAAKKE